VLVEGDDREGKEGSGSQRPPATEILAAVRHADAISSRRVGQVDPERCAWWTTGSAAFRGRRLVLIGAGVQQPLNKSTRATRAGELDAAPRIAVACAGEQDMSASEKFGFG
jgi:hypothetical protein